MNKYEKMAWILFLSMFGVGIVIATITIIKTL